MSGSVLMVTRNNLHLTKKALRSVFGQSVPCDVIVIDNQSTDGTLDWLRTKSIATIHYPYEKSLAACWNAGIKAFWKSGATEVLVINNDVELATDTYYHLRDSGRPFVTAVSVNSTEQLSGMPPSLTVTRPHPDFSCFMIRKLVTDRVGWFDDEYYPAYYEDNDYHVRMHRAGIEAVCIDLPFLHHGAQTVKAVSEGEQLRIKRYAQKNKERFREKYGCYPGTPEYEDLFKV